MNVQAQTLTSSAAPTLSLSNTSTLTTWYARLKQRFVIDFSGLDDLDLGTPEELDAYIGELFERGPHVRS
jgi:hypothetical protein